MAKRKVDLLNKEYNFKTNSTRLFFSIIPTNIYGPHDNFHLDQSHVVPSLIHRAYLACTSQLDRQKGTVYMTVQGSGRPMRQFIYGRDLAKLILWSLDKFDDTLEPRIIMCPNGGDDDDYAEVSIGHVAGIICKIFGEKFKLDLKAQFDSSRMDGQFRKTASNKKLRRLYPGFEFTKLELGLRETIDWFCSHYPRVRGAHSNLNKQ